MSFTYDWQTAPVQAQLRLMVGDTDASQPIFTDDEINGALAANNSQNIMRTSGYFPAVPQVFSMGRAAALLLNSLSSVKARLLVLKVLDVDIDGTRAAAQLKALGQSYIDQEVSSGYFAVSEMVQDSFSMRERLWKMLYRQQV